MSKQPTTDEQSGPVYKVMKLAAWGLFLYGIGLSMSHIYGLFTWLDAAPATAVGVVVFIDVLTMMGKVAQGKQFSRDSRRMGLRVQIVGASVSLVANVVSGYLTGSVGDAIAGAFIVGGYVWMERFAEKLRPASDDTRAEREAAESARREAERARRAAQREAAAAKRAAEAEAKAERARARREAAERRRIEAEIAEVEAMHQTFAETVAPVSPAALPTTYL